MNCDHDWRLTRFFMCSVTDMGRGLFAHRDCSRYRTTFRRARGRRTVSLHPKSTISGECADGGGNRCSGEPVGIHFFGGGELDFRLPPDPSRRKSPAAKPGRIVSRLLRHGAAILALAQVAGSGRKSSPTMEPSIGRGEFRLAVWPGGIAGGGNAAAPGGTNRISAWISCPFFDHQPDSKAWTSSWLYREPFVTVFPSGQTSPTGGNL